MDRLRKLLFWLHLGAGVAAGAVIAVMAVTGVALTYERQLLEWSARHLRSTVPSSPAERLTPERLLQHVRRDHPSAELTGLTVAADLDAPVTVTTSTTPLLVDAYNGHTLGRQTGGMRAVMTNLRAWHRWLAADSDGRPIARAITGWSNLLFLFLVISGVWIWFPRLWTWNQFKSILFFRGQYGTSKARDFNWHNVIGIWSALPLLVVVSSAVPMSFPWANNLIYRAVGEAPPAPRTEGSRPQGGHPARGGHAQADVIDVAGLDGAMARAVAEAPGWRTVSVRFPRKATDPFAFTTDRGNGGQPQLRATATVDRNGYLISHESFNDLSRGRRIRSVMRFAHTGEIFGMAGQTIAGLASAGAAVMVWTGLALGWRRLRGWLVRRRAESTTIAESPLPASAGRAALRGLVKRPSQELLS